MWSQFCQHLFRPLVMGLFFVCTGSIITCLWPGIFEIIVTKVVEMRPGSWNYEMWVTPPVPIYMEFYFFNWTNPEELMVEGKKPQFVEVGPYRFLETKNKKDVLFNENYTISFKQERTWYYDTENSVGDISDEVTTLNALAMSAAFVSRNMNYFLRLPLNQMLKSQPISIKKNVSELLFDGYSDTITIMGQMGALLNMVDSGKFDKFAWFYGRNASKDFEGVYNMGSGHEDTFQVSELIQWNYNNRNEYYPEGCNRIKGSTGDRFAPWRTKNVPLEVYSKEMCRSIEFDFSEESVIEGVNGYRYTVGARLLDNGTLDPANECYCAGECVPSGVLNISGCQYGSPGFVSFPHFYEADPFYLNQVGGLKPDADKHVFYATIEPTTGVPLDVAGRLQINILMQPLPSISAYQNLPRIFFPILWFEEHATISPSLALYVNLLLFLSPLGLAIGLLTILTGVAIIVLSLVKYNTARRKIYKDYSKPPNTDNDEIFPSKLNRVYSPTTLDCQDQESSLQLHVS